MKSVLKLEVVVILIAAVLLIYVLMISPIVGVADNGDFYRIMTPAGLSYLTDNHNEIFFGHMHRLFGVKNVLWGGGDFISAQILPMKAAILLNNLVSGKGVFDIRFLAFIYSVIFLAAIYLVIKFAKDKMKAYGLILAGLMVLIFFDVGYISYFNSFYGEAASYVFFFLMTGAALYLFKQKSLSTRALTAFFAASILFVCAKEQNSPLGIMIALYAIGLLRLKKDKPWKRAIAIGTSLILIVSGILYITIPKEIRMINQYHTVFFGILKDSPTPEQDLKDLGLKKELAVLQGTTYYDTAAPIKQGDPFLQKEFYDKINYAKILGFYLSHPKRLAEKMEITAKNAFTIRQGYLGNYEKEEGMAYGKMSGAFSLWSSFKKSVFPASLLFLLVFYGIFLLVLLMQYIKSQNLREHLFLEFLGVIALMGAIQFIVPMIGDGEGDLSKHLFMFNVCFDLMFVVSIMWILNSAFKMLRILKDNIKNTGNPFLRLNNIKDPN
ncbi:MAG: hypothetical protein N2645_03225 [Clostridia bacterium]|nr:hypothetical protein [Clostridia bacterium]